VQRGRLKDDRIRDMRLRRTAFSWVALLPDRMVLSRSIDTGKVFAVAGTKLQQQTNAVIINKNNVILFIKIYILSIIT